MTPLRKRMIDEMQMRNFSPKTIQCYVETVARIARHFNRGPTSWGRKKSGRTCYTWRRRRSSRGAPTSRPWRRCGSFIAGS